MPDHSHAHITIRMIEGRLYDGYTQSRSCYAQFIEREPRPSTVYVETDEPDVYAMWGILKVSRKRT